MSSMALLYVHKKWTYNSYYGYCMSKDGHTIVDNYCMSIFQGDPKKTILPKVLASKKGLISAKNKNLNFLPKMDIQYFNSGPARYGSL